MTMRHSFYIAYDEIGNALRLRSKEIYICNLMFSNNYYYYLFISIIFNAINYSHGINHA